MEKENIYPKENKTENKKMYQGGAAAEVFSGEMKELPIQELYGESAKFFANIIRERLSPDKKYTLADLGCFKGELLGNILNNLSEYKFHTIGVDFEDNLRENNIVAEKVAADLEKLPLADRSIDLAISRYTLCWNEKEKQKKMLNEFARIVRNFTIIQHAGADYADPIAWREKMERLLGGKEIPELFRGNHFFSSRDEIEDFMKEGAITFERIQDRRIENFVEVLIKRYKLSDEKAELARNIMGEKNYIMQNTWVIKK